MNDIKEKAITRKLNNHFEAQFLSVVNESHAHSVPANSETHFKVTLVSTNFQGQSLVLRHRSVYEVLQQEMSDGVHALALHTFTPEEWSKRGNSVKASPQCMGGSKSS